MRRTLKNIQTTLPTCHLTYTFYVKFMIERLTFIRSFQKVIRHVKAMAIDNKGNYVKPNKRLRH